MERSTGAGGSDTELTGIVAGGVHVDGVFQPFAGIGPTDVIAAAGVAGDFNIHTFSRAILSAVIGNVDIVIRSILTAVVEIFGLNHTWNGAIGSTERRLW